MTSLNQDNIPLTTINYSIEMEARRILYIANRLPTRSYQNRGFAILPKLKHTSAQNIVVFPHLNYNSINNFWIKTSRLKPTTPIQAPKQLLQETIKIVRPIYRENIYQSAKIHILDQWEGIEKQFWNNLFTLFPHYLNKIKQVNIYLTQSGTTTSFNLMHNNNQITILARLDTPIDTIIWSILTSLFRFKMQTQLKYSWLECQASIDWLIQESSLNCGVTTSPASITKLRNIQSAKCKQASLAYQAQLGFTTQNVWQQKDNSIYYGSIKLDNLSQNEQLLLEVLLTNYGKTVTNETILNHLWPNDYEISNWAITKQIQRLRLKLKKSGIHHPVIQAHRGKGYSLI